MLTIKEIKIILGSPVINIELTDEQIKTNIKLSLAQTKDLIKLFHGEDIKDYILDKLIIINCKKTWANSLNKYKGSLASGIELSNHNYISAKDDEKELMNLLKENSYRKTMSKLGINV